MWRGLFYDHTAWWQHQGPSPFGLILLSGVTETQGLTLGSPREMIGSLGFGVRQTSVQIPALPFSIVGLG